MSAISIENVAFAYDSEPVLQDLSVNIASGDFVCILGESGCGKSTLLRILAGLARPTQGRILIGDREITGAGMDRGVVFQDYSLFPWLTNGKNIVLALKERFPEKTKSELKKIVYEGLVNVGLEASVFDKYPFELSGGMRQRCAICRAFALDPPVLLMDEPFGALDAITRVKLQRLILSLWQKDESNRKTIIFVTHDVDEALLLANKILLFGSSPSGIIYTHSFAKDSKPPLDDMFEEHSILALRNELIRNLNKDIMKRV